MNEKNQVSIVGTATTFDSSASQKIITTNHKLKTIIDEFLKKYRNWEFSLTILITLLLAWLTTDFKPFIYKEEVILSATALEVGLYITMLYFLFRTIRDAFRSKSYNCRTLIKSIRDAGEEI